MFRLPENDAEFERLQSKERQLLGVYQRLAEYRDYLSEVSEAEKRSSAKSYAAHYMEMLDQIIPEIAPKTLCSLCGAEEGQESWNRDIQVVDTRKVIRTYAVLCPGCMNRVDSALRGAVVLLGQTVEGT